MSDFLKNMETTIRDATKLKKVMLKKGLKRAKAKCPECEGYIYGVLAGPKNHLHFVCVGSCKRRMME